MANYISKHTGKQIDAAVDAFLAGGGTGSVEVDTTLTQAGKAADAKATGDRLTALSEEKANKTGWTPNMNLGTDEDGNIIVKYDIFQKDVSAWQPVNALAGVEWTETGYFWNKGTLITTTNQYRSSTEKVPIAPNCTYVVEKFKGQITFYDRNGENGELVVSTSDPNAVFEITSGANQVLMSISFFSGTAPQPENMLMTRMSISAEEYNALPTKASSLLPLYGKKVVCFGDSIFGMYRGDTSAPAYVAGPTGATVYNVGFGGCRMAVHPYTGYNEFCMWALAKAISEGNWTAQEAAAASGAAYFPEQLAVLKSIDFTAVDYVVIHYGANDFGGSVMLDNANDQKDYSTFCGAFRYSIDKLLTAYPHLRIFVSLPCFRYWEVEGNVEYTDTRKDDHGDTTLDFVEALRTAAAEHNLPVIDSYHDLGINKYNVTTYIGDGAHHNQAGRKRLGEFIGAQLIAKR